MNPLSKPPLNTELAQHAISTSQLSDVLRDGRPPQVQHALHSSDIAPTFQRATTDLQEPRKSALHPTLHNAYRERNQKNSENARAELDQQHAKLKSMLHEMGLSDVDEKVKTITSISLFRGVTNSSEMRSALKKMLSSEPTNLPVMWGFRAYQPKSRLATKELNTLKSLANDLSKLEQLGLKVKAPIILADLHAKHNNVPPDAVPLDQGGVGNEGYEAYYDAVKVAAEELDLPTVRLSEIFAELAIKPHEVAKCGESLTKKPGEGGDIDPALNILKLSEKDLNAYVKQAMHMVQRYPTVPINKSILDSSPVEQNKALVDKAMAYIYFRQGEGAMLLPRLPEIFGTNVIPVHVSDPGAESIGVKGLYIFSKSNKDKNVADIPWKGVKNVIAGASKFALKEVEAIKFVQEQLIRKNGFRFAYSATATRVAVSLSQEGHSGAELLEKVKTTLDSMKAAQAVQTTTRHQDLIDKVAMKTRPKLRSHLNAQGLVPEFHAELKALKDRLEAWRIHAQTQGQSISAELKQNPIILKDE